MIMSGFGKAYTWLLFSGVASEAIKLIACPLIMWEHCGVVVRTLDLQSEGRGFESHSVRMPLDKAFCPQLSLSTQV